MSALRKMKRKIDLALKQQIIDASANKKVSELATEFKLPYTTVDTIIKSKAKTLEAIDEGGNAKRARITGDKHSDLEDVLLNWLKDVRSENIAVNGPMIKVCVLVGKKVS